MAVGRLVWPGRPHVVSMGTPARFPITANAATMITLVVMINAARRKYMTACFPMGFESHLNMVVYVLLSAHPMLPHPCQKACQNEPTPFFLRRIQAPGSF